jgi:hypothetical protein
MQLMSVSINTRVNKPPPEPQLEGFTMFAMYQEQGTDGRWGEPLYSWINCDSWSEVVRWMESNPIGSPMTKQ